MASELADDDAATSSSELSSSSSSSDSDSDSSQEPFLNYHNGSHRNMKNVVLKKEFSATDKSNAVCQKCGNVGPRNTFYSKSKQFCTYSCASASPNASGSGGKTSSAHLKTTKRPLNSATNKPSKKKKKVGITVVMPDPTIPFDWKPYLIEEMFEAAPVSCFKHAALSDSWDNIIVGMKLEVENKDCENFGNLFTDFYWIATVTKIAGYMVRLRYEGFGTDDSQDFWLNLCTEEVHAVGWCASQGKPLIPPKTIEHKHTDWKGFLVKRLTGARTLPFNFATKVREGLKSRFKIGMKLEVVDKNRISCVRVASIQEIMGGRLHVAYEQAETGDEGFWCHERSPLLHPIGWAQIVGHDLRASIDYAKKSLQKTLTTQFDENDCTWEMFYPVKNPPCVLKFKEGMKLEAIDPLNLSTICVATVTRVLRNNYLMIGIDGMMAENGSDWFCYHASSPHIFPVGFCELNSIHLTPPRGHEGAFNWFEYLSNTKSAAAPVSLFKKELPNHGFRENMHVEAVDLMEPRLICVGKVTRVVGRLLRIHFEGWDESYDQWCDCESPDLFPVGWCQLVGYRLEAPRSEAGVDLKKKKKPSLYKGARRKKKFPRKGEIKKMSLPQQEPSSQSLTMKQNYPNTAFSSSVTTTTPPPPPPAFKSNDEISTSRSVGSAPPKTTSTTASSTSFNSGSLNNNTNAIKSASGLALSSVHTEVLPEKWSTMDVAQFLRINECGAYCQVFSNQRIDGQKFLSMSKEDVMSMTEMKVGPSLKISHLIQQLKNKNYKL